MVRAIYGSPGTLKFPPVTGALEAIRTLTATVEVVVLTARLPNEVKLAEDWIEAHVGRPLTVRGTAQRAKAAYCAELELEVLIEDSPRMLVPLRDSATRPMLLRRPYNSWYECPNFVTCGTWSQLCEAVLTGAPPLVD